MKFDKYKFSRQYPAKFNKAGHNLPVHLVIYPTIECPSSAHVSDNQGRIYYTTDHQTHKVAVIVSATVSAAHSVARIISAYRKSQRAR